MKKKLFGILVMSVAMVLLLGASCTTETSTTTTDSESTTETTSSLWTSSTSQGSIASTDVTGTINDEDVTIGTVYIDVWDDEYSWSFTTGVGEEACDLIMDDNAVNFSTKDLQVGTFTKAMTDEVEFDDYHAYYHYEQADGVPMSVNTEWAATVVVTEIDEDAGTVTGYANFEFDDGLTEIDGAFTADYCVI